MQAWWLNETRFAGAEHLDRDYVAGYDAKAQFDPAPDIEMLSRLGLGASSRVVDLGAGTGSFALAAAAAGAAVVAVDVSPAMVAEMRRRVAESPHGDRVEVVTAGFLSYEHDGPPFDFVFSRNALHQLPDFWKVIALRRIAGMLRPGGLLRLRDLVYDMEPDGVDAAVDRWMRAGVADAVQGYTATEFAAHVREEFSTFTWLLEPMLERAGFEIIERESRMSMYAAYTCRRGA